MDGEKSSRRRGEKKKAESRKQKAQNIDEWLMVNGKWESPKGTMLENGEWGLGKGNGEWEIED
jgi:hypothetical protein